ncbi:hypothetical protein AKJ57_02205 [candidate division MSBL1 archaeon SCGC-AAA259A05]|uniref:Uncharacterized protein n=1 Tax=candidate division MSBL1 archaeon SCGC-AAA259A05 TaxID=1698259 RepID=A0A133UAH5_9EURY|nr:hypothetical protein AKJ57_02205 [candidate division MSBL1 archaeon SCGC-AAA259A05]
MKREAKLAGWDRGILFDIEEKDDDWIQEVWKELRAERNRRKKTEGFEGSKPKETEEEPEDTPETQGTVPVAVGVLQTGEGKKAEKES